MSAVALLRHYLSEANHVELLAAVTGKSVVQTRELIAERFPRQDVASSVRKLPERRTVLQPTLAMSAPTGSLTSGTVPCAGGIAPLAHATESATEPPHFPRAARARVAARMEPLSARRYKVQFTASADLAHKLELARDLMRHSYPSGELGPIVERALDLLIERLTQRRFGKGKKATPKRASERAGSTGAEHRRDVSGEAFAVRGTAEPDAAEPNAAEPHAATFDSTDTQEDRRDERARAAAAPAATTTSANIPRSARRTVVERDGLGCSWVDEQGARCGSRAWLEYARPRAKGGGAEPDNLRLLCRHHNRFAAERRRERSRRAPTGI